MVEVVTATGGGGRVVGVVEVVTATRGGGRVVGVVDEDLAGNDETLAGAATSSSVAGFDATETAPPRSGGLLWAGRSCANLSSKSSRSGRYTRVTSPEPSSGTVGASRAGSTPVPIGSGGLERTAPDRATAMPRLIAAARVFGWSARESSCCCREALSVSGPNAWGGLGLELRGTLRGSCCPRSRRFCSVRLPRTGRSEVESMAVVL